MPQADHCSGQRKGNCKHSPPASAVSVLLNSLLSTFLSSACLCQAVSPVCTQLTGLLARLGRPVSAICTESESVAGEAVIVGWTQLDTSGLDSFERFVRFVSELVSDWEICEEVIE